MIKITKIEDNFGKVSYEVSRIVEKQFAQFLFLSPSELEELKEKLKEIQ